MLQAIFRKSRGQIKFVKAFEIFSNFFWFSVQSQSYEIYVNIQTIYVPITRARHTCAQYKCPRTYWLKVSRVKRGLMMKSDLVSRLALLTLAILQYSHAATDDCEYYTIRIRICSNNDKCQGRVPGMEWRLLMWRRVRISQSRLRETPGDVSPFSE